MVTRTLSFGDPDAMEVRARLAAAIESTPDDAVVQVRITGAIPATLNAAVLRAVAGTRTVALWHQPPVHEDRPAVLDDQSKERPTREQTLPK
jgi:hypothetical protein